MTFFEARCKVCQSELCGWLLFFRQAGCTYQELIKWFSRFFEGGLNGYNLSNHFSRHVDPSEFSIAKRNDAVLRIIAAYEHESQKLCELETEERQIVEKYKAELASR